MDEPLSKSAIQKSTGRKPDERKKRVLSSDERESLRLAAPASARVALTEELCMDNWTDRNVGTQVALAGVVRGSEDQALSRAVGETARAATDFGWLAVIPC